MSGLETALKGATAHRPMRAPMLCLLALLTCVLARAGEDGVFKDPSTAEGAQIIDVTARQKEKVAPKAQPVPDATRSAEGTDAPALPKTAEDKSGATETRADKGKGLEPLIPLDTMLNPPTPEEELPLYNVIRDAIKSNAAGGRAAIKRMKLVDVSTRTAAVQALDRALSIQLSAHADEVARRVLEEARAVFLPVFALGPRYDNTNTFERKEELTVAQKIARQRVKFFKDIPGGVAPGDQPNILGQNFFKNGEIQFVDPKSFDHFYVLSSTTDAFGTPVQQVIDENLKTGAVSIAAEGGGVNDFLRDKKLGYIDPSKKAQVMPLVWNYNIATKRKRADPHESIPLSITQQLPWGPVLSVTVTEAYHDKPYDKFGHTWNRPWYTNFSTSLFLPLPGTKNFGPYAPQDTSVKLQKLAKKAALWDLKSTINSTLLVSDLRYLALVNALKNLEATMNNRKTIEALQKQTADLLDKQRATQFGKDQIDSELFRIRVTEEQAWNAYILASDSLVDLLAMDPATLLIPVGYSKAINEHPAYKPEEAVSVALEHRPELKSDSARTRSAEVFLRFTKQQSRPDISVSGSATWDQVQTPDSPRARGETGIGFRIPQKSLLNTFNSDTLFESYSFTFRRQFINRAEHARIDRAAAALEQQHLSARITEDTIVQQVNDALASLDSAKASVEAARVRAESSRKAYELTLDQQREGRITEFEVVSKNQERLDADFSYNNALVSYKIAETRLMFAEGMLPSEYPERTAPNEFHRYRLGLLKSNSVLQFFSDGKDKDE